MRNAARKLLNRFPLIKNLVIRAGGLFNPRLNVSSEYVLIENQNAVRAAARLAGAWTAESIPARQRQLVDRELRDFSAGAAVQAFDTFIDLLRPYAEIHKGSALLEIGCSSGYYSEVLKLRGLPFRYSGCDYSKAFVHMARQKYPDLEFKQEDATHLSYPSSSFDIVISGCCLLHIPDYENAIKETARVASDLVMFHRTPLAIGRSTEVFTKSAYGVETVEIHLSDTSFYQLLAQAGLEVLKVSLVSRQKTRRGATDVVSVLCRKITSRQSHSDPNAIQSGH